MGVADVSAKSAMDVSPAEASLVSSLLPLSDAMMPILDDELHVTATTARVVRGFWRGCGRPRVLIHTCRIVHVPFVSSWSEVALLSGWSFFGKGRQGAERLGENRADQTMYPQMHCGGRQGERGQAKLSEHRMTLERREAQSEKGMVSPRTSVLSDSQGPTHLTK